MKTIVNTSQRAIAAGVIAVAVAGCGASPGASVPHTANVSSNVLQFAVGTANLYGAATALNVVATYRQPSGALAPGDSGALLDSPTITLPAAIPTSLAVGSPSSYDACSLGLLGPASTELGGTAITSTSQTPGSTTLTTFGQSGGVFGLGIEPFNSTGQATCSPAGASSTGTPYQVAPYPVPLYDASSPTYAAMADPNAFVPWGGPPAFSLTDSGGVSVVGSTDYPSGTAGLSEGLDVFAGVAPVAGGKYTLSVAIPANTGAVTQTSSFTLPAGLKVLGAATAPVYTADTAGDGGGTLAFVMPTGATEAYVQVTDFGPALTGSTGCNGASASAPVYYTLETTASGTLTLPTTIGPGKTPSVCTAAQNAAVTANAGTTPGADQVSVQTVAFDYDLYSASYPNSNGNAAPSAILAQSSDDVTISAASCQIGAALCTPTVLSTLKSKAAAAAKLRRL